ncbi:hypothetical protein AMTR_s00116p00086720 [Amborella trichopoda]|uniref:Aspartic peptidase DDI1-type domain-containing protein n=1 Tax=Amborella trichopoda TaxID=13333 RepID=W1NNY0_AMBTC|nr:hypothetical protein AMTR_s00116p00086720 [Amborella trichopoda]
MGVIEALMIDGGGSSGSMGQCLMIDGSRPPIVGWEDLKHQLKELFLSGNAAWTPWVQAELTRQGIKGLPAAVIAAESIVDFKLNALLEVSRQTKGKANETRGNDSPKHQGGRQKQSLSTVQIMEEDEAEVVRVTPLQLHAIKKVAQESLASGGLMYIRVTLNGKEVKAMVDMGATHNFVDDFEVILGLEFLAEAKAAVVSHLGVVTIYDDTCPCMALVEHKGKGKGTVCSASQCRAPVGPGYLFGHPCAQPGQRMTSMCPAPHHRESFGGVCLCYALRTPKVLTSSQGCGPQDGARGRSLNPSPYPLSHGPNGLAEVSKQLNELLDAGMIQPSKTPYGTPILFQKKQEWLAENVRGLLRLEHSYKQR